VNASRKSGRGSGFTTVVAKGDAAPAIGGADLNVLNIDFRRGLKGEGRIIVTLADPNTPVDMKKRGKQLIVTLKHSKLPAKLERRLDVTDFATPVRTVDAFNHGNDARIVISAITDFDHIAYQANEKLTIDVKPVPKKEELVGKEKRKFPYTGERLSLNFQNIDVRAVLQLDIILKTKGLAKRESGNVILIAPTEEIAAQEKLELEAKKQVVELAPLVNETIQVNYAKASDLANLIKSKEQGLLSDRGSVTVDQRTNKLLVTDTADHIDEIIALVKELDIPIRQVLIESRVVLAGTTFSKELGVKFGVSTTKAANGQVTTSGSLNAADSFNQFGTAPQLDQRLNVNLPAAAATAGRIGLAIAKLPFGTMLDLELSAAQAEGKSEETGTEIPYQQASSSGATSVSFKKAGAHHHGSGSDQGQTGLLARGAGRSAHRHQSGNQPGAGGQWRDHRPRRGLRAEQDHQHQSRALLQRSAPGRRSVPQSFRKGRKGGTADLRLAQAAERRNRALIPSAPGRPPVGRAPFLP